jgi:signal transduction histidine kinase
MIESGQLSLTLEPISLNDVLRECREMIEMQVSDRNISLEFPNPEKKYLIYADYTHLKQVLVNLLSNAIKYNKVGGSIIVSYDIKTLGRIRICVQDSGLGLSLEKQAHLYEPFNRLGRENGAEEGTGIGLVVCKRLVELMGGVIGVESAVGIGSVFWFEMNLKE